MMARRCSSSCASIDTCWRTIKLICPGPLVFLPSPQGPVHKLLGLATSAWLKEEATQHLPFYRCTRQVRLYAIAHTQSMYNTTSIWALCCSVAPSDGRRHSPGTTCTTRGLGGSARSKTRKFTHVPENFDPKKLDFTLSVGLSPVPRSLGPGLGLPLCAVKFRGEQYACSKFVGGNRGCLAAAPIAVKCTEYFTRSFPNFLQRWRPQGWHFKRQDPAAL